MVLLPEERGMTLAELRQIAARQQHQIESQQQLLVAKEQRLKFLRQQEACHHTYSEQHLENNCLITLRDKIEGQELKLRQLRALRSQVEQQKTSNSSLGTELDSIRALFSEKEKELDVAVSKVEELSHQLDEIRKNSQKNYLTSSTSELENLRRELTYRTKLSEQHNKYICQQREKISNRQNDIALLDKKINELNERLNRKRLLNEHFASQVHLASLSPESDCSNFISKSLPKNEPRAPEVTDDLAANLHAHHKRDFGEFSLTKNDPKYQTLPYNTKFTLKEKQQLEDISSSSTEDDSISSKSDSSMDKNDAKLSINLNNFSSTPFSNNSGLKKVFLQIADNGSAATQDCETISDKRNSVDGKNKSGSPFNNCSNNVEPSSAKSPQQGQSTKLVKPAVPPKPALSVRPMLMNRKISQNKMDSVDADTINLALTVLKNKSTEKEKSDFSNYRQRLLYYKCVPRQPPTKEIAQDPLFPKSRILTYFSKTLLQPEGGSHNPGEKRGSLENPKRKSAFEQLPIKPKPLTIRKNPSIEPPKLKVQSITTSSSSYRQKTSESQPSSFISRVSKNFTAPEIEIKTPEFSLENGDTHSGKTENMVENSDIQAAESQDVIESAEAKNSETIVIVSEEADCLSDGSCSDEVDETPLTKKGNLKGDSGSIRVLRRVSFDPLALLLDAALEGELELVKKIASEVVNPSAANDEGITALHNSICAGQFDVVKFLVEFGCDVNAPDSDGWTPLHCAASCNNLAMVKFLVERGACVFSATLSDQETAAEKCEEDGAGFDSCSEYLYSLQENLGVMNNGVVYAVYDYEGENTDELSFRNGDMLTILRRSDDEENEWWWCRLHDQEGYVPRNLLGLYPRVSCQNPS